MMGDGQVSMGPVVVKPNAKKIRRILPKSSAANRPAGEEEGDKEQGGTIVGFAGSTADAFTLFERLEAKLEQYPTQLTRACVELAKDWRTDRYLRRLEAMIIAMDASRSLFISGEGDLLTPDDEILAVGSGAPFALAAARAYVDGSRLGARQIVQRSLEIAAEICIYTNAQISLVEL